MVSDFDCWPPKHDNVDVASVIGVVEANAGNAAKVLARLLRDFPAEHEPYPIGSDRTLDHALPTPAPARDRDRMKKLAGFNPIRSSTVACLKVTCVAV
jgi:5'-methylthioadenosine phosphorylase